MTVPLFPYGYARPPNGGPQGMGTMLSWEAMLTKTTVNRLHPEVLRRFHALIHDAYTTGVPLGVGTGWRVQPDPPPAGFAKPGNSWHESCPVSPSTPTALAIDTVPNISWDWMQIHSGRYGLRSFRYVNNEPWHVQPAEISTTRRYATELPALVVWELPGDTPTPLPDPVTLEEDDDMDSMIYAEENGAWFITNGYRISEVYGVDVGNSLINAGRTGPLTKVPHAEIQGMIDRCWTGGRVPSGYTQPKA